LAGWVTTETVIASPSASVSFFSTPLAAVTVKVPLRAML
jgi:hypothetical protein